MESKIMKSKIDIRSMDEFIDHNNSKLSFNDNDFKTLFWLNLRKACLNSTSHGIPVIQHTFFE